MTVKVTGQDKVLRNLRKEIAKIQGGTKRGMTRATVFLQGESQQEVPVEFGPLINSAFSDVDQVGDRIRGRVGYTQDYAAHVHEMPSSNKFTKLGTGPNFLIGPAVRNARKLIEIIRQAAKVRKF